MITRLDSNVTNKISIKNDRMLYFQSQVLVIHIHCLYSNSSNYESECIIRRF